MLQQQPESGEKVEAKMGVCGWWWGWGVMLGTETKRGREREGLWLVGKRPEEIRRRYWEDETGRENWEDGEGVTANGVGLAEERREYREWERVGRRQAMSDSSTTGKGPLNDSLFLHDFNSWQSTGPLVASWQLYHYLLALSLLCILRLRWWRVGALGFGGGERESR